MASTAARLLARVAMRLAFEILAGRGRGRVRSVLAREGGVMWRGVAVVVEGGMSRSGDGGMSALISGAHITGAAGGGHVLPSALLLSSRRLALLARSRFLLPERCG